MSHRKKLRLRESWMTCPSPMGPGEAASDVSRKAYPAPSDSRDMCRHFLLAHPTCDMPVSRSGGVKGKKKGRWAGVQDISASLTIPPTS